MFTQMRRARDFLFRRRDGKAEREEKVVLDSTTYIHIFLQFQFDSQPCIAYHMGTKPKVKDEVVRGPMM